MKTPCCLIPLFILAAMLMPHDVSAASSANPAADHTAPAAASSDVPDDAADTLLRSQALRKKLNRVQIASVAADSDPNAVPLMDYIRQIESLQLPRPKTRQSATGATAPAAAKPTAESAAAVRPAAAMAEPNQPPADVYAELLAAILREPADILHAFDAAETLYRAGDCTNAAAFYHIALQRMTDTRDPDPDRLPWTLFQIANCMRLDDPPVAAAYYRRLIADYPASPWTPAAYVQLKLIEWCDANRPNALLEKYASDPNRL